MENTENPTSNNQFTAAAEASERGYAAGIEFAARANTMRVAELIEEMTAYHASVIDAGTADAIANHYVYGYRFGLADGLAAKDAYHADK